MKWNCKKIVIAATMMQLGLFCTADVAKGTVSEEKIRIIDDIVETKIKEAKGGDALSEVLDAVAAKMQLDTDKDTTEYSAYINELQEQTRKKYPLSDRELEIKYSPIAENAYPTYNVGDKVSIVYQLHGKPFTVSGPFYRQDSRFVWVGSKKIPKFNLPREYADRFDPAQTKRNRAGFVQRSIDRYHHTKNAYLKNLKRKNADKIGELRGNILYEKKWRSPREVVMAKYAAVFARQENSIATAVQKAKDSSDYNEKYKILEAIIQKYPDHKSIAEVKAMLQNFKAEYARKTAEVKNILAYCSQPNVEPPLLKNQYGIDLLEVQLLSNIEYKYRGIPDANKLLEVLNRFQQVIARRIISAGYEKVKAAKTHEEMFPILRDIIASCPNHTPELKAVRSFLEKTSTEYVNLMIAKAKTSDNYSEAFKYLDKAKRYCPDAPNIDHARNLYSKYSQELEQKRQAERCPACRGSGRVIQSGFIPGQAMIGGTTTTCPTCSGSGKCANAQRCPVCNGRGSRIDLFSNRPMQCSHCRGSGYVTD